MHHFKTREQFGSIKNLWLVDTNSINTYYQDNTVKLEATFATPIPFTEDTAKVTHKPKNTKSGLAYQVQCTCFCSVTDFQLNVNSSYLVVFEDFNNQKYVAGSPDFPLRIKNTYGTGQKVINRKGFTLDIKGLTIAPIYPVQFTFRKTITWTKNYGIGSVNQLFVALVDDLKKELFHDHQTLLFPLAFQSLKNLNYIYHTFQTAGFAQSTTDKKGGILYKQTYQLVYPHYSPEAFEQWTQLNNKKVVVVHKDADNNQYLSGTKQTPLTVQAVFGTGERTVSRPGFTILIEGFSTTKALAYPFDMTVPKRRIIFNTNFNNQFRK